MLTANDGFFNLTLGLASTIPAMKKKSENVIYKIISYLYEMLIGSLDIGIRNIGFAIWDTKKECIKYIEIIDLLKIPGCQTRLPFGDQSIVFLVKRAIKERAELFKSLDAVGIEKQMTRKMVLIQFAFECILDDVCTVLQITPRAVKTMFGTSRGNHKKNKQAAILKLYSMLDAKGIETLNNYTKKDDIADSVLQAMYTAYNYEELVQKKIKNCTVPAKKKRKRRSSKKGTKKKKKKFFIDRG